MNRSLIVLGRSSVFYARPRLEPGSNRIAVGLPPQRKSVFVQFYYYQLNSNVLLDILNKLKRRAARPVSEQSQATQSTQRVDEDGRQLLQHIFPRQHKLPSVFSSGAPADKKVSARVSHSAICSVFVDVVSGRPACANAETAGTSCATGNGPRSETNSLQLQSSARSVLSLEGTRIKMVRLPSGYSPHACSSSIIQSHPNNLEQSSSVCTCCAL